MTEVPEHLLQRSRERRAALGLGGDAGGEAAPAPAQAADSPPAGAAAPAASPAVVPAAASAAPMAPAVEEPEFIEVLPPPVPHRAKTPIFAMVLLVALPLYAFVYFGAFGSRSNASANDPVAQGNAVFHNVGCSGCHGANGEGGIGPKLAGGEATKTFPNVADHIAWVKKGSTPVKGQKYGDPNRPGGQHGPATGGMPAFGGTLTDQQIQEVVAYERQGL